MTAWVQMRYVAGPGRCQCVRPARTSLGSVIGFLTIENAFESAKVPFRRSRSVVETGAADFVLRLLYYGLRQLLQTLTSPHSVNLHLRCALDVVEPVICVGYRLTYRGNAMVGHEQDRFVAEDLGKALAFRGIKSWASVIVVISVMSASATAICSGECLSVLLRPVLRPDWSAVKGSRSMRA